MSETMDAAGGLVTRGIRAYFASVDRVNGVAPQFDPGTMGRFAVDAPPAGWVSAGAVTEFAPSAMATMEAVRSGAPAVVKTQLKAAVEAEVRCTFSQWSRLAMALSAPTVCMNVLHNAAGVNAGMSGGQAEAATAVLGGSTATVLQVAAGSAIAAGDVIAVDADYAGQTGFVGAWAAGAYLGPSDVYSVDAHFVRRVTMNVARVQSVSGTSVTLAQPLPAGVPDAGMKAARVMAFASRDGGGFVPEWSAVFVLDGVEGDRVLLHYPRLQPMGGDAGVATDAVGSGLERVRLTGRFRALPVTDVSDGAQAVCVRSYLPAPLRLV